MTVIPFVRESVDVSAVVVVVAAALTVVADAVATTVVIAIAVVSVEVAVNASAVVIVLVTAITNISPVFLVMGFQFIRSPLPLAKTWVCFCVRWQVCGYTGFRCWLRLGLPWRDLNCRTFHTGCILRSVTSSCCSSGAGGRSPGSHCSVVS